MKRIFQLLALSIFCCSANAFSQSSAPDNTSSIILVASNQVADNTVVHTIRLNTASENIQDDQVLSPEEGTQVKKLQLILSKESGINSYQYDRATHTFTIVTGNSFTIDKLIEKLNTAL